MRPMLKQQITMFHYAKYRSRIALFVAMRLGKSLVALRWAKTRTNCNKILILSPLSVTYEWASECKKENIDCALIVAKTTKQKYELLMENKEKKFFITNYQSMLEKGKPSQIAKLNWDCIILDESTKIKDARTKLYKTLIKTNSIYRAILTGEPTPESSINVVPQFIWLYGECMGESNFWQWRAKHTLVLPYGGYSLKHKSYVRLKKVVQENCIRLTKKDADIQNKIVKQQRKIELPVNIVKAINQALTEYEFEDRITNNALAVLTWVQQLIAGSFDNHEHITKFKEALNILQSELKSEQVVVWGTYTKELELCTKFLCKKISTKLVHGSTKNNNKKIDDFKRGKFQVLVAQPKCLQMGIDLSCADTAIFLSRHYSYETNIQTEARIEHPKKKKPLLIIDVVANNTIDQDKLDLLQEKEINSKVFLSKLLSKLSSRKEGY